MSKYIDSEKLQKKVLIEFEKAMEIDDSTCGYVTAKEIADATVKLILSYLDEQEAEDVVKVVRCADCKHA